MERTPPAWLSRQFRRAHANCTAWKRKSRQAKDSLEFLSCACAPCRAISKYVFDLTLPTKNPIITAPRICFKCSGPLNPISAKVAFVRCCHHFPVHVPSAIAYDCSSIWHEGRESSTCQNTKRLYSSTSSR